METVFLILLLTAAAWFVLDSLRARERAIRICADACRARDLQLLDQTVVLQRLRLRWGMEGICLLRVYRFDFSEDGVARDSGQVVLVGERLEALTLRSA